MNKILFLNTDSRGSGIQALAPPDRIKDVFGYPPITAKKWSTIKANIDKLGVVREVSTLVGINGDKFENIENRFIFNEHYQELDVLVVDTVDGIYWAIKEYLLDGKDKASRDVWDRMLNISVQYFDRFGGMGIPVIMNCHERGDSKGDLDVIQPFLQGSFKDQLGNYFDVILYTRKYKQPSGKVIFKWQVVPDSSRDCRATEKLYEYAVSQGGEIPQDYGLLFKHIGIENPKILVIGSYGSGKTTSLRTLKNVTFNGNGKH